jgi:hypothetical protein
MFTDLLRKPLTFGHAVVLLVAAAVVGGGAFAVAAIPGPDGRVQGCVKKSNPNKGALRVIDHSKNCSRNEQTLFWNQRGPKGAQGPAGPQGFQGQQGQQGAQGQQGVLGQPGQQGQQGIQGIQGSASASAVFGGVENLGTLAGGASVFTNAADTVSAPGGGNILTPNATVTLRDLAVLSNGGNLPTNVSLQFTLNGPSSSISCTIPTGSRSCDSGGQTATLPPASEISMQIQNTGTVSYPASPTIEFGWRATG